MGHSRPVSVAHGLGAYMDSLHFSGPLDLSLYTSALCRISLTQAICSRTTGATLRLRGGGGDEEPITYPSFVMEKGDFNHVIRIFNTNLPGGRTVLHSLIGIKGVGRRFGHAVIKRAGIDGSKRMGVLTAEEIEKLVQVPFFSGHHATTIVMCHLYDARVARLAACVAAGD